MISHRLMIFSVLLLVILLGGCRRVYTFVPVEGTITQGSKPLVGVLVTFLADSTTDTKGPRAWGMTDATGHYRLHTDQGNDGAVVGKHLVCIRNGVNKLENPREPPKDPDESDSKVPLIYGSIDKTPLRAEVRPGGLQIFDFDIPK